MSAQQLVERLRQAVQGCTVHTHGPVQAWKAIDDAVRAGDVSLAEVLDHARAMSIRRRASLQSEGVPDDDPRSRKETTTQAFIEALLKETP